MPWAPAAGGVRRQLHNPKAEYARGYRRAYARQQARVRQIGAWHQWVFRGPT